MAKVQKSKSTSDQVDLLARTAKARCARARLPNDVVVDAQKSDLLQDGMLSPALENYTELSHCRLPAAMGGNALLLIQGRYALN